MNQSEYIQSIIDKIQNASIEWVEVSNITRTNFCGIDALVMKVSAYGLDTYYMNVIGVREKTGFDTKQEAMDFANKIIKFNLIENLNLTNKIFEYFK